MYEPVYLKGHEEMGDDSSNDFDDNGCHITQDKQIQWQVVLPYPECISLLANYEISWSWNSHIYTQIT